MQNIGIPSLVKQKPGPVANGWLNAFTSQSDQVAIRGQTVEIWAKRKNLPNTFLRRPKNGKHLYFFRTKGRIKHNLYDIFIWIMALALSIFNLFDIFPPVDRLNSVGVSKVGMSEWEGKWCLNWDALLQYLTFSMRLIQPTLNMCAFNAHMLSVDCIARRFDKEALQ